VKCKLIFLPKYAVLKAQGRLSSACMNRVCRQLVALLGPGIVPSQGLYLCREA